MATLGINAIPSGSNVLLDANILIYALSEVSAECVDTLHRCQREDISGFATVEIINEVSHRLMVAEAYAKGLILRPNVSALKGRKSVICGLRDYWTQTVRLLDSNLFILDLNNSRIRHAQVLRESYGLLTTDATILAAAYELGIEHLATNDTDFDELPDITVYRPADIS